MACLSCFFEAHLKTVYLRGTITAIGGKLIDLLQYVSKNTTFSSEDNFRSNKESSKSEAYNILPLKQGAE